MKTSKLIYLTCLKHLPGQHNQKRHGYRYGGLHEVRRSLRGQPQEERVEYRKRANLPIPERKENYIVFGDSAWKSTQYFSKKQSLQKWAKNLSDEERSAIGSYTSAGHMEINRWLRKNDVPGDAATKRLGQIKSLEKAIDRSELPEGVILHRGFSNKELYQMAKANSESMVGSTLIDKGFGSTSTSGSIARDFASIVGKETAPIKMTIRAPKGTKGAIINLTRKYDDNMYFDESEVLLQRGTQYRVDSVKLGKIASTYGDVTGVSLEVTIIGQEPQPFYIPEGL